MTDETSLDSIDISLLTCQPHDEIYSLYGHTSIRIQNHRTGDDYAVNFGVFDSSAGWFAIRFMFGLTDYMMAIYNFDRFLSEYRYYGSGIFQQRINMSRKEKSRFLQALAYNTKPENVIYRYNVFYNNCTTRARDLILEAMNGRIEYQPTYLQRGDWSFRQLIHLKNADSRWARVGNDLLLGVGADVVTSHDERQFLPEVLQNDFDSACVIMPDGISKPLVEEAHWVLLPGPSYVKNDGSITLWTPTCVAAFFFCVILSLCLIDLFLTKKTLRLLNYCIVFLYGSIGLILGVMLFSEHPTVNFNLQILIFNPCYLILGLPKLRLKWRWHFVISCVILFFIGSVIQSYAEGMMFMALALLLIALNGLWAERHHRSIRVK